MERRWGRWREEGAAGEEIGAGGKKEGVNRSRQREGRAGGEEETGRGWAGQGRTGQGWLLGPSPISPRGWRHPEPDSRDHTPIFLLVQGERGIPGRKGVKGQKGEPGPPGLDQPCPVVRVRAGWEPQPRPGPPLLSLPSCRLLWLWSVVFPVPLTPAWLGGPTPP